MLAPRPRTPGCSRSCAFAIPSARLRPAPAAGRRPFSTRQAWRRSGCSGPAPELGGWIALDAAGLLTLSTASALFLASAVYAPGYLATRPERDNRVFVGSLLVLPRRHDLASRWRHHLGLLWVAMEATTLATAPLIYFNARPPLARGHLEVPAGLLGGDRAGAAGHVLPGHRPRPGRAVAGALLLLDDLVPQAAQLSPALAARPRSSSCWSGYGTKMGLAPMHTWKPDTYGEAPARWSARCSAGGVTSCAFLAMLRVHRGLRRRPARRRLRPRRS